MPSWSTSSRSGMVTLRQATGGLLARARARARVKRSRKARAKQATARAGEKVRTKTRGAAARSLGRRPVPRAAGAASRGPGARTAHSRRTNRGVLPEGEGAAAPRMPMEPTSLRRREREGAREEASPADAANPAVLQILLTHRTIRRKTARRDASRRRKRSAPRKRRSA